MVVIAVTVFSGIFSHKYMNVSINIEPVNLVSIAQPIYNHTCTGIYRVARETIYYNDFEALPEDWVMINGTLGARGYVGPGGYWDLVEHGFKGSGLRGFPLIWQVREHKTYGAWNPDIRFTPQSTHAIRIDSYTAGAGSLGNGYLMVIMPVELINNTLVRNRFNVYYSFSARTVGFIDIVNRAVDRRNDTYFATYDYIIPPWQKYGEGYSRIYSIYMPTNGTRSFDITNQTTLPGFGPYVTYSYVLSDYWIYQTLYFDVFFILVNTTDNRVVANFTFPYNSYRVVLERSGTYGDYGYLDYGFPGFTAYYWNRNISEYSSLWISSKVKIRGGVGWGSIILTDRSGNYYAFALNTSGYLSIMRNVRASWILLNSSIVPGYANNTWYTLVLQHSRFGQTNYFTLSVYDTYNNLLAQVSASDATFTPIYAGLGSYALTLLYVDVLYDDFIVSLVDPKTIRVQNIPGPGYVVELWDNLGMLVSRNISDPDGMTTLMITNDTVVGTGYDGVFRVYYPNNYPCLETRNPVDESIVGGDIYNVTYKYISVDPASRSVVVYVGYGGNTTYASIFNITVYDGYAFYAYLLLDTSSSTIDPGLSVKISLINATGHVSGTIMIYQGVVVSYSTSPLILITSSGSYVYIEGSYTSLGLSSLLKIYLVTCSTQNQAICLYTPIYISINS